MLRIRCSSLSKIMTEPKLKSEILSVGAKTEIEMMAKEFVYGFKKSFWSKETEKGIIVEDQSISLLNEVLFENFSKNTERKNNDWLTGECDIFTGEKVHDIKSPWSMATFPATRFEGQNKDYEWQLRGYMMLWEVPNAELDYCLVNTPDELIKFDDESLHYVDHIDPMLRVTRLQYARDLEIEGKIKSKVEAAHQYYETVIQRITEEHA